MKKTDNEKLSSVQKSGNEGLSVISSVQSRKLKRYADKARKSTDIHAWDGDLVQCWRQIFQGNQNVLDALESSIVDENCTKMFTDWGKTVDQFKSFQEDEPVNGLHYVNVRAACAVVKSLFYMGKLDPCEVHGKEDLKNLWSTPKASAGAVNIRHSKEESIDEIWTSFCAIKENIKRGVPHEINQIPSLVFHRAQISGFIQDGHYSGSTLKKKDRFVWGLDGASVSIEGQYANPYIERLAKDCLQYAGGKSPEVLRSILQNNRRWKNYWTSIDYSKFDQSVPSWLIYWCFEVIKSSFAEQYWPELDWIAYNFVNTKVAIPGVGFEQKHKGIPSGSNFTQVVGSMANAVMALSYIASLEGSTSLNKKVHFIKNFVGSSHLDRITMFVMGDDNLMFTSEKLDLSDLSRYVKTVFGEDVNPDKCDSGKRESDPTFLKREWRSRGEYQDPMYLVINTSHPERRRSYDGYSPWHILYGLYLTYSESFPRWITERFLAEKMEQNGGIEALERISRSDLPGVFRAYGGYALKAMTSRAKHLLSAA